MASTVDASAPHAPATPATPATAPAWRTALVAAAATCVAVSTIYMTQPVFPEIAASFDVDREDARFVFSVASFVYALAFFLFGPLSDRVRTTVLGGAGAATVATLVVVAAYAPHFAVFALLLALAGVAAAAVPAAMIALMPRIAPDGLVGAFFGLIIGATVAGITLGRSLTGVVAEWTGWRTAVALLAVLNAVAALALRLALPAAAKAPPPLPGGARAPVRQAYLAAARMFGHGPVVRLLGIGVLLFFGYLGVVTFLTYRLEEEPFGHSAGAIGAISLIGLVGVFGAPLAGRLSGRVAPRRVVLLGLGLVAAGIATLGVATHTALVVVGTLLLFLGVFSCQPAVLVLLARTVPAERRGAASSLYMLVCLLAGSVSSAALGPVWSGGGWGAVTVTGVGCVALAALVTARLVAADPAAEGTPRPAGRALPEPTTDAPAASTSTPTGRDDVTR
ncbi:MFS transporter [Streptomyces sp. 4N509B]|uniref:MFS transporter n=1 Tax=Streptomyces sp. 4N509B TaxID=3457413 RepID=UPI003FD36FCA